MQPAAATPSQEISHGLSGEDVPRSTPDVANDHIERSLPLPSIQWMESRTWEEFWRSVMEEENDLAHPENSGASLDEDFEGLRHQLDPQSPGSG